MHGARRQRCPFHHNRARALHSAAHSRSQSHVDPPAHGVHRPNPLSARTRTRYKRGSARAQCTLHSTAATTKGVSGVPHWWAHCARTCDLIMKSRLPTHGLGTLSGGRAWSSFTRALTHARAPARSIESGGAHYTKRRAAAWVAALRTANGARGGIESAKVASPSNNAMLPFMLFAATHRSVAPL